MRGRRYTDRTNGDCGQSKGVTEDAAEREGGASAMSVTVFHLVERGRAVGAVRGHRAVAERLRGGRREKGAWAPGEDQLSTCEGGAGALRYATGDLRCARRMYV